MFHYHFETGHLISLTFALWLEQGGGKSKILIKSIAGVFINRGRLGMAAWWKGPLCSRILPGEGVKEEWSAYRFTLYSKAE